MCQTVPYIYIYIYIYIYTSGSKPTFYITYYSAFQNVRSILEELQGLLGPDKEHKKDFSGVPIVGIRNGKNLKD